MRSRDPEQLLAEARAGDRGATGRLLSLVERGGASARAVGRLTFVAPDRGPQVVGITGAPGAGKSTLTDRIVAAIRRHGDSVGVLAIDPTSPFSGGAILGDRVRMQGHATDDGVFIRSMATRGHLGGLALAAPEAIRVLGAVGLPLVIVETVGVGQVEVEVAGAADTTVVVLTPGWGDAVQANKAGLLEIADIFVVNKADRPGAGETRRDLANMLDMNMEMGEWRPPILLCTASNGEGTDELWPAVEEHQRYLDSSGLGAERRNRRLLDELRQVLVRRLEEKILGFRDGEGFEVVGARVLSGELDPYDAADALLDADAR